MDGVIEISKIGKMGGRGGRQEWAEKAAEVEEAEEAEEVEGKNDFLESLRLCGYEFVLATKAFSNEKGRKREDGG